jgi:hypothetical protein
MTYQIIVVIIGIALVLLSIFGGLQKNKDGASFINARVMVFLGMLGVCLLIYGGYSFGLVTHQAQKEQIVTEGQLEVSTPVERVQITSPLDGEAVRCRILTMGVYPEGHEKDLWVLLQPTDDFYYPQSDDTNTSFKRNGEWQVITRFGGSKDEPYEVIVYETDDIASAFFTETIEEWKENLSYPGLTDDELPDGATELDRITVTLAENCRGVF